MRDSIPVFRQIQSDPARSARELQVFWAAVELLDVHDWRALSVAMLESQLLLNQRSAQHERPKETARSTIALAQKNLVESGYLCKETTSEGAERYRVPLSRVRPRQAPRAERPRIAATVLHEAVGGD